MLLGNTLTQGSCYARQPWAVTYKALRAKKQELGTTKLA